MIIQNDDFHTWRFKPIICSHCDLHCGQSTYLTLFKLTNLLSRVNKMALSFKWNLSTRNQEQPKYIYIFITTAEWCYLFKMIQLFSCSIRFQPYRATIPQNIRCFEAFSRMVLWFFLKMHVERSFLIFKKIRRHKKL